MSIQGVCGAGRPTREGFIDYHSGLARRGPRPSLQESVVVARCAAQSAGLFLHFLQQRDNTGQRREGAEKDA